jgi:protein TonB
MHKTRLIHEAYRRHGYCLAEIAAPRSPPSLPGDLKYAVMWELVLDEQGRVLQYRLLNSSGSLLFDQSALDALSKLTQVRPPPEGAGHTIIVKFFPPTA